MTQEEMDSRTSSLMFYLTQGQEALEMAHSEAMTIVNSLPVEDSWRLETSAKRIDRVLDILDDVVETIKPKGEKK